MAWDEMQPSSGRECFATAWGAILAAALIILQALLQPDYPLQTPLLSAGTHTCAASVGARNVQSGVMKVGESSRCNGVPAKAPDPWPLKPNPILRDLAPASISAVGLSL